MQEALFLNGVYRDVLEDIMKAQKKQLDLICYLQPYSPDPIKLLATERPDFDHPFRLYVSTTDDLGHICYTAEIVGWENKQEISKERLKSLNLHIIRYQPSDREIYMTVKGRPCVNLISVANLRRIPNPFSVSNLLKRNGSPLRARTTAGKWSYVRELPSWVGHAETAIKEQFDADLDDKVEAAIKDSRETRINRLSAANRFPEKVQVVSIAYRRNPDIIAEIMIRANGQCERCGSAAPFLRAKDGSPYLEAHHWVPLADGGEDTVRNAAAVCPNCHRELHFGRKQNVSG